MKYKEKEMSLGVFCKKVFDEIYNKTVFQFAKLISDKAYIRHKYKSIFGIEPSFDNPKSFNEKLNWLKIYDRNPQYTLLADKLMVRKYVSDKIGEEYLVPLLGNWKKSNEIDFGKLPNQFVLKCTHDSASTFVCKNKAEISKEKVCKRLDASLRKNYFWYSREWVYKHGNPQIIAEEYLEDESGKELKDYKIFCFNGEPKIIQVDFGRFTNHERNMYTTDWNLIDLTYNYPRDDKCVIQKPEKLETMILLARKLSEGITFVRTDFYSVYGVIYFGEMTFYPEAGFGKFYPEEWNDILGGWINLPSKE